MENVSAKHHHHDIWHVNYNQTVETQAAKGWNGVLLVFFFNSIIFAISFYIFLYSRSGRTSLYCMGTNAPRLAGNTRLHRFRNFVKSFNTVAALNQQVGDEGAFYLLFQVYSFQLLVFMSILAVFVLIPIYAFAGDSHFTSFEILTIRTLPNASPWLWAPVIICYIYTIAFVVFIKRLSNLCTNRDPTKQDLLCMRPSDLAARSIFINRGLPVKTTEQHITNVLQDVFPGYVSQVALVFNLTEFKSVQAQRESKERELERFYLIQDMKDTQTLPWMLQICPGTAMFPKPWELCFDAPDEERIQAQLKALKREEVDALQHAVSSNNGAGRAFITFHSASSKARFVRRVRTQAISSMASRAHNSSKTQVEQLLRQIQISKWHLLPAPEPDDIDWGSVSYPFVHRTLCIIFINVLIVLLLLLFTSPVAISAWFASGKYSVGAADFMSKLVDDIGDWVSSLSPAVADMIFAYTPTMVLVMINWALLNVLYYAGRLQPIFTDSAKEQKILRTAAVYLVFNTLFVPSFAFASIDALLNYLQTRGQVLDVLGKMFLHNSGTFFLNYIIQRTLVGSAVSLLRVGEAFQFMWFKPRAVTDEEHREAVQSWEFYTGIQSALQISVLAVVIAFSTVVPVIVPVGAFYMIMQHWVDKYSLVYVRPHIPGRGAISCTATHATIFCLIIYQAGMAGFFLVRGSEIQSSAILILLLLTYILSIWWYLRDKQAEYEDTAQAAHGGEKTRLITPTENPLYLYREEALRQSHTIVANDDDYGTTDSYF